MKDSEVLKLRRPPPFYPQLASRSLLSVALLGCLPSLDAAVCVMRLHGLFFGTGFLPGSLTSCALCELKLQNLSYLPSFRITDLLSFDCAVLP